MAAALRRSADRKIARSNARVGRHVDVERSRTSGVALTTRDDLDALAEVDVACGDAAPAGSRRTRARAAPDVADFSDSTSVPDSPADRSQTRRSATSMPVSS